VNINTIINWFNINELWSELVTKRIKKREVLIDFVAHSTRKVRIQIDVNLLLTQIIYRVLWIGAYFYGF